MVAIIRKCLEKKHNREVLHKSMLEMTNGPQEDKPFTDLPTFNLKHAILLRTYTVIKSSRFVTSTSSSFAFF